MVIGVTGHRDLCEEDRDDLEKQVRNIFEGIRKNYPHTPMVLLSPSTTARYLSLYGMVSPLTLWEARHRLFNTG